MTPLLTNRNAFAGVLTVAALFAFAARAEATCVTTPLKDRPALSIVPFAAAEAAQAPDDDDNDARAALVGMWVAEFRVGQALYDQTLQQFHSDGTENILSNGLPPVLGNVCLGIWKQIAPRTFRLRHMAWNWDAEGRFAGLFEMFVTFTVARNGRTYSGTFIADSCDLSNKAIPELHAEGSVRASRIAVD